MENIDDSVQRLLELVVFLHRALFGQALILLSLVKFDPVLLEKLQGSLSIFLSHRHGESHSPPPPGLVSVCVAVTVLSVITDVFACPGTACL